MIKYKMILLSTIFIPLAGAFFLPLLGRYNARLRNIFSFILIFSSFVLSLSLIPLVISGKTLIFARQFPQGFNLVFTADSLAVFMACVSAFLSTVILLYSFSYISHYENQNEYYSMVTLFLGAMMGLVFSANLIFIYVFWEITAVCSWRLIGFFREKHYILRADKAFLITIFGSLLMLIGFISIYQQAGSFDLAVIREVFKSRPLDNMVVLLLLCGIFAKSATLPFQTWLPDAGIAPSPVTALLHAAVLVKIGVYVFARIFVATFDVSFIWHTIIPCSAGVSALVAGGAALIETDLKRIIAYSTISQIGFIFLGFALGKEIGIIGALLYILMHGISKAGLFLCAGIVEQNTKTRDITSLGGLIKTMPLTAVSFLFCAFSVMGIPPFGGFFSKYMVFSAAAESGNFYIIFLFLAGACLTIAYLFRVFNMVFMGETHGPEAIEGSPGMLACVVTLAILSLASGILINFPFIFAKVATWQIMSH
ncbi:MAG: NADH-quinone oxidoreductase subunit L [Candidatus Omnitrophota bacterium]